MAFGFDKALKMLKQGDKVRRCSWPEGMYVVMQAGHPEGIAINENTARATELPVGTVKSFRPYLMMHTEQGDFVPWVAAQTELLADNWQWISDANQCAPAPSAESHTVKSTWPGEDSGLSAASFG